MSSSLKLLRNRATRCPPCYAVAWDAAHPYTPTCYASGDVCAVDFVCAFDFFYLLPFHKGLRYDVDLSIDREGAGTSLQQ